MIKETTNQSMTSGVMVPAKFRCSVCHKPNCGPEAFYVENEEGNGYCCTEACAERLEKHHALPHSEDSPRPGLLPQASV